MCVVNVCTPGVFGVFWLLLRPHLHQAALSQNGLRRQDGAIQQGVTHQIPTKYEGG